ncbi:MAG: hypothetical protein NZ889_00255 [Candidatus Pacearchaeota archaeon]|nr:hypothetical protein [Candidatus Pacearchaeota archaeon]
MFERKKAQIGELTHDVVAFLVAFFLVIIFLVISIILSNSTNKRIEEDSKILQDKIRMQKALEEFLEKKIKIQLGDETEELELSQILILRKELPREIKEKLEEFCIKNLKKGCCCYLEIRERCENTKDPTEYNSCLLLPSNETIAIVVAMYIEHDYTYGM